MSHLRSALALGLLLAASPAGAQQLVTRFGETGLLDVPDAEVVGTGGGVIGAELRYDHVKGLPARFGPLPFYAVSGLSSRLEMGFSVREWGQPGDPVPLRNLFGVAAKLRLTVPAGLVPGLAVDLVGDRLGAEPALAGRLIASTSRQNPVRAAAYLGVESGWSGSPGLAWGGSVAVTARPNLEAIAEAYGGPRGPSIGAGVRWGLKPTFGLQLALNYMPDEEGFRLALGAAFGTARKAAPPPVAAAAVPAPEAPPVLAFAEERPRFRLRIRVADPASAGEPRHRQHGQYSPPALAAAPRAAPARLPVPSAADVAQAEVRDLEAQLEARQKRLRASDEALSDRELAAQAESRRQEERAGLLTGRETQLEARQKRIGARCPPTAQLRQIESQEAQLAATERQAAATERGLAPAMEAALAAERDAGEREQAERSEKERLAALADLEKAKAKQAELRRQAADAGQRTLTAMEARVVAKGERIDGLEKQVRARGERLDAWQRRLDARAGRVELLEKCAADQQRAEAERARPEAGAAVAPPRDKAVFVMVVKSPTAILKEPAARAPAAAATRETVHPGVAVEKAVAAATVVSFATPASRLSELDRESIEGIARLAAREGTEVLVWARAKEPSLMDEATRRSEEIKSFVIAAGGLAPRQVVTRITTRPGAQGVDVVVSALREGGKVVPPAAAPPAGAPAPAAAPVRPADRLLTGETAKRQIREAVVAVQPSIERCVSEQMVRRGLTRAEGTLKLTVTPQGRVTGATAAGGKLGGPELEECLRAASAAWSFPPADAEYVVDVPITVVGGGAER